MVHSYNVKYNGDDTLSLNLTQYLQLPVPATAAAAEIQLTVSYLFLLPQPSLLGLSEPSALSFYIECIIT